MSTKKSKTNNFINTKSGAASLYVVIFTTLLLGVISLSFTRIIISEASQTSNSDLSQSAYDSTLAGIEDAKLALLQYHDCLSGRYISTSSTVCDTKNIVSEMQKGINNESCDVVQKVLGRQQGDNSEVIIKEENNGSKDLLQAYTCVKIKEELDDYRTTLNDGDRIRVVPVRTDSNSAISYVTVKWFSKINSYGLATNYLPSGADAESKFGSNPTGTPYNPPAISFELIQASQNGFNPSQDFNVAVNNSTTNRAEVFLYPYYQSGGSTATINKNEFAKTANMQPDGDGSKRVFKAGCDTNADKDFACSAKISLPSPKGAGGRSDNAVLFRVALPYGTPETDISITLYDSNDQIIYFKGVQASIDSTGRANDLYRRIETRVELVDNYYAYPEFEIQTSGTDDSDAISKDFYSTINCWYSNDSSATECPDNNK